MNARGQISRMTLDLPAKDHKRLKALAAVLGKSMREVVTSWIQERLYSDNIPNKKTLKAIDDAEKGKNLVRAKNAEDLFRKLGI